ncbi:MAG: tetratricopeptide repeat protein [Thermoanaerobaculia bacterium]
MRKFTLWTLLLVMVSTCVPIFAATATEFYVELLRRGIAEVEAGRDEAAVTPLRLAAFGLVESIEHYETAQVYLVIALDRMNQPDGARDAALRIIAAERVERKFASLALPAPIRAAVMASARKLLPSSDVALLLTPSPAQSTLPPQMSARPPVEAPRKVVEPPKKVVEAPKKVAESSSRQVDEKPVATTPAQPAMPTQSSSTTRPLDDAKIPPAPKPAPVQAQTTPTQSSTTRPLDGSKTPPAPKPAPVQAQTTPTQSATTRQLDDAKTPPAPKPAPVQTQPKPTQSSTTPPKPAPAPAKPTIDVPARLAAGERALIAANLAEARKIYRELLEAGGYDHSTWIRVAEGLYRSRDFSGALSAFQHVGTLRPGEEAYRYYVAVALYETGQYEPAKRELAGALPYIEVTPDVQRYRAKIDGAR